MDKVSELGAEATKALQKHRDARDQEQAQRTIQGEDVTSLNKLLQWGAANADSATDGAAQRKAAAKSAADKAVDAEWLDAAFPDMNEGVRQLVTDLDAARAQTQDEACVTHIVDCLCELQEFLLDLNYARNVDKLGALDVLVALCAHDAAAVRATAVWAIGTSMAQMADVQAICVDKGCQRLIATLLDDDNGDVRAKAVMAASALVHYCVPDVRTAFDDAGGFAALAHRLADSHVQTRRRTCFFLQHAAVTGNGRFIDLVLADSNAVAAFADALGDVDACDVADVEPAVGAVDVLAERDLAGLLRVAPGLPNVLDRLAKECDDDDSVALITNLAARLA